jgi:hypothetical protein
MLCSVLKPNTKKKKKKKNENAGFLTSRELQLAFLAATGSHLSIRIADRIIQQHRAVTAERFDTLCRTHVEMNTTQHQTSVRFAAQLANKLFDACDSCGTGFISRTAVSRLLHRVVPNLAATTMSEWFTTEQYVLAKEQFIKQVIPLLTKHIQ